MLHFETKTKKTPAKEYKPTVADLAPALQRYIDRQIKARQALADDAIGRSESDPSDGDAIIAADQRTSRLIAAVRTAVKDGFSVKL